jgi:hypothetical protein
MKSKSVAADGACNHVRRYVCFIDERDIIVATLLPQVEKRIGKLKTNTLIKTKVVTT